MNSAFKSPLEIAKGACAAAQAKSSWSIPQMLIMGILAGAYVAFAGFFVTAISQDLAAFVGSGMAKFLMGIAFSAGLAMIVVAGGELFTGNCMMPLGTLAGCQPFFGVLRNWFWVYLSNLLGALLVVSLLYGSGLWRGGVGVRALEIAADKMSLPFGEAFFRGILCNWLVVLAVWMSMAAADVAGKILAIFFPIVAFVASGFEHSVANMYFMSMGMLVRGNEAVVTASGIPAEKLAHVGMGGFFHNLLPVTLGNMVGGILFVAVFYYLVFREKLKELP